MELTNLPASERLLNISDVTYRGMHGLDMMYADTSGMVDDLVEDTRDMTHTALAYCTKNDVFLFEFFMPYADCFVRCLATFNGVDFVRLPYEWNGLPTFCVYEEGCGHFEPQGMKFVQLDI